MRKKLKLFASLIAVNGLLFSAFGVTNSNGIEYFKSGQPDRAKILLLKNLNDTQANKAETCYYLGEIYYGENKLDSASYYFKKGLSINPEYSFNIIGEGKVLLKTNLRAGEDMIKRVLGDKNNKKNVDLHLAAAKAFYDAGQVTKFPEYLEKAKNINKKNADIFVFEGDLVANKQDPGKASVNYEQAMILNPNCIAAYVKYADIYSRINPTLSISKLEELLNLNPQSAIAQRELAEAYYNNGKFSKAVELYSQYINNKDHFPSDVSRYATLLFFNKDFEKSLELANQSLQQDPNNFVMRRIAMYNDYELKNYAKGLEAAETLMSTAGSPNFIFQDYLYYGRLLTVNKQGELAIPQFEKALSMDSSKVDLYKELSEAYESMDNYDKAIEYYRLYVDKNKESIRTNDYYILGKMYYNAGSAGPEKPTPEEQAKKNVYFTAADEMFAEVAAKAPENYLGNFWRARANAGKDPESIEGLAKPYYEMTLKVIEPEGKETRALIECYKYLGYYNYLKNDIPVAKDFWSKILKLDPTNDISGVLKQLK